MSKATADQRANARLANDAWYIARETGVEQSNPAHLSNCRDCYGNAPAKHVENPPTWTADELAEQLGS